MLPTVMEVFCRLEDKVANIERKREVVSAQFGEEELRRKLAEGWKPVVIEWERQLAPESPATTAAPEVPYGLRVSGDCAHLEEDPHEREVLFQIMELTIQDGPYWGIAAELNRRGFRRRDGSLWTPIAVFQMLPRLIEAGPGILTSDEWRVRREKMKTATP